MKVKVITICVIAGERSGDLLGAELINSIHLLQEMHGAAIFDEFKAKYKDYLPSDSSSDDADTLYRFVFHGMGGQAMESTNCNVFASYEDLSHIGIESVIFNFWKIFQKFQYVQKQILQIKPDVIITIDSSGFNFRLVNKLRKYLPHSCYIHYVAPTVWAYSPQRSKIVKKLYDRILLLYKFEEKYFADMRYSVVGFNTVDRMKHNNSNITAEHIRKIYNLKSDEKLITVMMGSRKSEIDKHAKVIIRSIEALYTIFDGKVRFCFLTHSDEFSGIVRQSLKKLYSKFPKTYLIFLLASHHKNLMLSMSDIIWTKCGTASLESIAYNNPIIAFYKVGLFTALVLKGKLINQSMFFALPNILSEKPIVPELIQEKFNSRNLLQHTLELLENSNEIRENLKNLNSEILGASNSEFFVDGEFKAAKAVLEETFLWLAIANSR